MAKKRASPPMASAARRDPERQEFADPLAVGDPRDHLEEGLAVPEAQVQPVGLGGPDQPVLEALHGERHRARRGDDVEAQLVAHLVGAGHELQVAHRAVGAEAGYSLVLGSVVGVGHRVAVAERHLRLAADGAGVAGAGAAPERLVGRPVHLVHALERALPEVAGGEDAAGVQRVGQRRRALRPQVPALGVLGYLLREAPPDLRQRLRVVGEVGVAA